MDEMRATLDSLMGRDRNEYGSGAKKGASFKGENVCKFFLVDFCPHDLFPNTRVDLGPCDREHRADLKVAFEMDPEHEFYHTLFETEFARYLQRLVDQMENRIRRVQQRIDANNQPVELSKENEERVNAMNAEISELLKQQDEAGAKGDIDAAEKLNEKVAFLQREVSRLKNPHADIATIRESQLRVCATCGAMQSTGDAMCRFESHVSGKQHRGCEKIRAKLSALKETEAEREAILKKYDGKNGEVVAAAALTQRREAGARAREEREECRDRGSHRDKNTRDGEPNSSNRTSEYASSRCGTARYDLDRNASASRKDWDTGRDGTRSRHRDRDSERDGDRYRDRHRDYGVRDKDTIYRSREDRGREVERRRGGDGGEYRGFREASRHRERDRDRDRYRSKRSRSREGHIRRNGQNRRLSLPEREVAAGDSTDSRTAETRPDARNALKSFIVNRSPSSPTNDNSTRKHRIRDVD